MERSSILSVSFVLLFFKEEGKKATVYTLRKLKFKAFSKPTAISPNVKIIAI